jgi:recombination protein RecR
MSFVSSMLPAQIEEVSTEFRKLPGVGVRGSQKIALDILQLNSDNFVSFLQSLENMRKEVTFCSNCGFFAEKTSNLPLCNICKDASRLNHQICLVEKATDIITVEKSQSFRGVYHVLEKLISPLDNIFPQDTKLNELLEHRLISELPKSPIIELIIFFKQGFSADATTAYLVERLKQMGLSEKVKITKLAQGLPMYFNTETLDSETLSRAIQDRKEIGV